MHPQLNRQIRLALILSAVAVAMLGLSFAAVPLYKLFCQVTGFAGTPNRASASEQIPVSSAATSDQLVTIRFDASISDELDWEFYPENTAIQVGFDKMTIANYIATNNTDEEMVGRATFNVTPLKVGNYFTKIDCFCFSLQTLAPGETASLPIRFYVNSALVGKNSEAAEVDTITLSYTFYPYVEGEEHEGEEHDMKMDHSTDNSNDHSATGHADNLSNN